MWLHGPLRSACSHRPHVSASAILWKSWVPTCCLPPAVSVHTWEPFSIPASRGADAKIPSLLDTITTCCPLLRIMNGRGQKKRHFGNCIADSLFLLFSEKMMKTPANKNQTDSAGKCSWSNGEPAGCRGCTLLVAEVRGLSRSHRRGVISEAFPIMSAPSHLPCLMLKFQIRH